MERNLQISFPTHIHVRNTTYSDIMSKCLETPFIPVWYKTKFGSQNLATKFGNHLCMATKIGRQS